MAIAVLSDRRPIIRNVIRTKGVDLISSQVHAFLEGDHTEFVESIADDITQHLAEVDAPLRGYAILTGRDGWVEDLMAAFDTSSRQQSFLQQMMGEQFDVHSWQMSPRTFNRASDVLEQLNEQFRSLYSAREDSQENDEIEDSHVSKLRQSVIEGFRLARTRCPELRRPLTFKVFCIPDSDLDVDLQSSRALNSMLVHFLYRIWR